MAALTATLIAVAAGAAAMDPADSPAPTANRRASANYDAVVHDNPTFRSQRAHIECDPIESADLRQACFNSFEQPATTIGSPPGTTGGGTAPASSR
jgi:hypothetical protein